MNYTRTVKLSKYLYRGMITKILFGDKILFERTKNAVEPRAYWKQCTQ